MANSDDQEKKVDSTIPVDWPNFKNQVADLAQVLEKMNLSEYISYLNSPRRMLLINFASGLVRGLGVALGASILAGIALVLLRRLVFLNLPVIGGVIAELVKIVNAHNGY
ncbi:DUF5665 domain-containing protein [Desulfitobacterium sp.]|uniref:DUF5665 domain-containing protein n=1 Tax=Desulfitobacterium sp. TaxID=49981 RepID=UPI002B71D657|nr:DUF5665 domain-containing protein [Desulfitobacterium sp.]HVJ50289.1 DUF5665 domain-containing protein [Desulfitobacterium sp.]